MSSNQENTPTGKCCTCPASIPNISAAAAAQKSLKCKPCKAKATAARVQKHRNQLAGGKHSLANSTPAGRPGAPPKPPPQSVQKRAVIYDAWGSRIKLNPEWLEYWEKLSAWRKDMALQLLQVPNDFDLYEADEYDGYVGEVGFHLAELAEDGQRRVFGRRDVIYTIPPSSHPYHSHTIQCFQDYLDKGACERSIWHIHEHMEAIRFLLNARSLILKELKETWDGLKYHTTESDLLEVIPSIQRLTSALIPSSLVCPE